MPRHSKKKLFYAIQLLATFSIFTAYNLTRGGVAFFPWKILVSAFGICLLVLLFARRFFLATMLVFLLLCTLNLLHPWWSTVESRLYVNYGDNVVHTPGCDYRSLFLLLAFGLFNGKVIYGGLLRFINGSQHNTKG